MPQSERQQKRGLPARVQLLLVAAGAIALLLVAFGARFGGHPLGGNTAFKEAATQKTDPGTFHPTKEDWAALKVEPVVMMDFTPEVAAEGHIAIDRDLTTPVFMPYSGRIIKVMAKLGQTFKKGAPLLEVDSSEVVNATHTLVSALADLKTARSELALARLSEKRQHALYLAKGTSLKDWQQSQAELTAARNRFSSAEIAVASARQNLRILGNTPREIAQIESAPPRDADPIAWLRSPISGTVIARAVSPGENISAGGSDPVFKIGNLSTLWLLANVRESDAPLIRVGEPVAVRVLAYPGRLFDAKVSWVSPEIDAATHSLPVRADVENRKGTLKPGMFAHFTIATGPATKTPAVPQEAIVFRGERKWVWVVLPGGNLTARSIRTGAARRGMVSVLSGLRAGERIVTSGSLFIDRAARGG